MEVHSGPFIVLWMTTSFIMTPYDSHHHHHPTDLEVSKASVLLWLPGKRHCTVCFFLFCFFFCLKLDWFTHLPSARCKPWVQRLLVSPVLKRPAPLDTTLWTECTEFHQSVMLKISSLTSVWTPLGPNVVVMHPVGGEAEPLRKRDVYPSGQCEVLAWAQRERDRHF